MLCVWWNAKGLAHLEILDKGDTVDGRLYAEQMGRVDPALRKKRIDPSKVRFLHDNARPHISKIVHEQIDKLSWKLLPHPPYSPDLAPSDYHLFRSMKQAVSGQQFKQKQDIENWVANYFASKNL
ncbi:unnamed protein product, partial [Mesorhabditis belari]|uniref:Transposase n=1 Tax=Mesorhabditis belari TaxID=2138241 RepID=A0AAF3EEF6_9BILA